jgi:hypothetical protein
MLIDALRGVRPYPGSSLHVVMSRFSWGVNPRHHPRNEDRQQRVTILSGHHRRGIAKGTEAICIFDQ